MLKPLSAAWRTESDGDLWDVDFYARWNCRGVCLYKVAGCFDESLSLIMVIFS